MKLSSILLFSLILYVLNLTSVKGQVSTNDKTLMVELFATNIFNVDEIPPTGVYEREEELVAFANAKGYKTIILNRFSTMDDVFPKDFIKTAATNVARETRIGNFLTYAHTHGISKVGIVNDELVEKGAISIVR